VVSIVGQGSSHLETETPALYSAPSGGQVPSGGQAPCPSSTGPLHALPLPPLLGSSSGSHHWRGSSSPQGWSWEQRLHPGWALWLWRPDVAIVLQPLVRDHLHVAEPGHGCLPTASSSTCSPGFATIRRAYDGSGSALAPISGDPYPDTLVPNGWRVGPAPSSLPSAP
jgi:hypothetical protein